MADKTAVNDKARFTRRALLLGGVQLGAFGLLGARLYQMQILDADRYTTLSDENRINTRLVSPPRGQIYDRFGYLVASNRDNLKIVVVPEDADDLEDLLERVSAIAPIDPENRSIVLRRARRQRAFVPVTVREDLSWGQFARINVEGPDLPGVRPEAGYSRQYHFGKELAHVVGYVGPVNEWEGADNPALLIPGYEIGKSGVEKVHDAKLRGTPGVRHVEVNAGGRVIRELNRSPTASGTDMVLTIDTELQKFALDRLQDEDASAVVMDVHTGEVLALASTPGFDANQFTGGMTSGNWRGLIRDPRKPLMNRSVQGQYPPGSTFKMVVALAALESGMVRPQEGVRCTGRYFLGRQSFGCWRRSGHGFMNMHSAIQMSCDYYFYEIANRIGINRIAEMANKLGLGTSYESEFMNAKPGLIPTPAWKQATQGQVWFPGETVIAAIGQGYVLSTPLQLAVYAARIANGGHAVTPRLVRAVGGQLTAPQETERLDISEESLAFVRNAMNAVVNGGGTGAGSRFDLDGKTMAGKTGTSQVHGLTAELQAKIKRNGGTIPRKYVDHALFVAFTPVDEPRYAIAVVVEHGGGGSKAAAPVAKDILMKALELDVAGKPAFQLDAPIGRTAEDASTQDG
jgi:penicillin-binding protein 2